MNNAQILSQRAVERYNYDGYIYVKDKESKDGLKCFWRCHKKDNGKNDSGNRTYCNGRIWTNTSDGSFHSLRIPHTCSNTGNAVQVEIAKVITAVKRRANDTMERPQEIRAAVSQNISDGALGQFPSTDTMRKLINRSRQDNRTPNPQTRQDIVMPIDFTQYETNPGEFEDFLLEDSGFGDNQRILIFGREYHKSWSEQMREVFMDGTFLLTPPLFSQIFVLLARRGDGHGFVFPILFCLLPNKLQATYCKLFQMIKNMWPEFNPDSVNVDYEVGIHNALRAEFANVTIRGCFFHLVQNLRKHLSALQLISLYTTDSSFALKCRMVTSVAFVPENDVVSALTMLENRLPPELEPIISWFTNTYVGRLRNNGTRAPPLFPYEVWSVYERTLLGSDRTNNFAEACHKKLQQGYGVAHPELFKFIGNLKIIQKTYDADYERYVAGYEPPQKRKRYEEADERILNKVSNYEQANMWEYLRGLSHNYVMD